MMTPKRVSWLDWLIFVLLGCLYNIHFRQHTYIIICYDSADGSTYIGGTNVRLPKMVSRCMLLMYQSRVHTILIIFTVRVTYLPLNQHVYMPLATVLWPIHVSIKWHLWVDFNTGSSILTIFIPKLISIKNGFMDPVGCRGGSGILLCKYTNKVGVMVQHHSRIINPFLQK